MALDHLAFGFLARGFLRLPAGGREELPLSPPDAPMRDTAPLLPKT